MSGIDVSIYNQLLRAPKSVAEYDAEAMQNQTNRLALQMGQQKADEYTRSLADQEKLRGIVSQFGDDKTGNYNALLRGGRLSEAQDYAKKNIDIEKAGADVKHVNAQTDETHMKAVNSKMTLAKDQVNLLQTPEQAAQWVRSMYADPDLGKVFSHGGDTPDTAIARIPTDPKSFAQWKMQASLGADKLIEYTTPNANTMANNATSVQTAGISAAASKYSADKSAQTAGARLAFDKEQAVGSGDAMSESMVDAIGTGKMAPPSGMALRNPKIVAMMERVTTKYPEFDATEYAGKTKAMRDFTTGKQGDSIRSFAVASDHLKQLDTLVDALDNGNLPLVNKLGNIVAQQTGSVAPTNFDAAKGIVAKEVLKSIVAGGGGVDERQELAHLLDNAKTPKQLKGVIQTYHHLMEAQKDGLTRQYEISTGRKDAATRFNYDAKAGGGDSKVIDFGSLK